MTYDFKNPKHREILHWMGFSDTSINNAIEATFSKEAQVREANFYSNGTTITFSEKCFKRTLRYRPNEWNPFPEVIPPAEGEYIVTIRHEGKLVTSSKYWTGDFWIRFHDSIVAFRALPEPYQPEPPKDMHPDAIAARRYMGEEE